MGISKITVSGNIGRDPELRSFKDGTAILKFSLAGNTGYGEKKVTTWYDCSIFGKKAESLSPHLNKGKMILVHGDFQIREWEKDGRKGKSAEIRVSDIEFMGGKQDAKAGGDPNNAPAETSEFPPDTGFGAPDGGVPF